MKAIDLKTFFDKVLGEEYGPMFLGDITDPEKEDQSMCLDTGWLECRDVAANLEAYIESYIKQIEEDDDDYDCPVCGYLEAECECDD